MSISKILKILNEDDTLDSGLISQYRKWCDKNGLYVDKESSVNEFANKISTFLKDNIKFN